MLNQHPERQREAPMKDLKPDIIVIHFPHLRVDNPCWAEPYGVRYNGEWEIRKRRRRNSQPSFINKRLDMNRT